MSRSPLISIFVLAIALAACSSTPTTTPSPTARPFPTIPPASEGASVAPSEAATASPVVATPEPTALGCAFTPQDVAVLSDRLAGASVTQDVDNDLLSFHFAAPSASRPQGDARLTVGVTEPPFYKGASSDTYTIAGNRYLLLRFTGQTLVDEAGKDIYSGPTNFAPEPPIALAEAQLTDASEGTIAFVVGYDSLPCPTLTVTDEQIDLVLPH